MEKSLKHKKPSTSLFMIHKVSTLYNHCSPMFKIFQISCNVFHCFTFVTFFFGSSAQIKDKLNKNETFF